MSVEKDLLDPKEIKIALTEELHSQAFFVITFGSLDSRFFNEESDVDLGVYFDSARTTKSIFELSLNLSRKLGRSVDLIDLKQSDPIIQFQIYSTGKPLFIKDRDAYVSAKALTLSEYLDFKRSRAVVENKILEKIPYDTTQ